MDLSPVGFPTLRRTNDRQCQGRQNTLQSRTCSHSQSRMTAHSTRGSIAKPTAAAATAGANGRLQKAVCVSVCRKQCHMPGHTRAKVDAAFVRRGPAVLFAPSLRASTHGAWRRIRRRGKDTRSVWIYILGARRGIYVPFGICA